MMYKIVFSKKFKKEYRRIKNNIAFDKNEFQNILICLSKNVELDHKYKNHKLYGEFFGCFECHIKPDILLIYKIEEEIKLISLLRIGSHSELFK